MALALAAIKDTTVCSSLQPFVKWAGGKRQLLGEISPRMPSSYGSYFEPFIGGGALLFDEQPIHATINDINSALINTYLQIKTNPNGFIRALASLDRAQLADPKAFYYSARTSYNERLASCKYDSDTAALFVFINKHCFNGLYRVNARGGFNVPFNNSCRPSFTEDNIYSISDYLQDVAILNGDFEVACTDAKEGDFVFFDSPYAPLNPTSFEAYTKEGFGVEEHKRLARLFETLSNRGCYCMLTNHNTQFINELYGDYKIDVVAVRRAINSDASKRTGTEVIIRNY